MMTFRHRNILPPGGYQYTVPETGQSFLDGVFNDLVNGVRLHLAKNSIPVPPDLAARIEHSICLRCPKGFCRGEAEPGDAHQDPIRAVDVREATSLHQTRLKWSVDRFLASDAVVAARVAICKACPENVRGYCTTCNGLRGFASKIVGTRAERYEKELGVCQRCKCLLPVKVHISDEALRAVKDSNEYPPSCWVNQVRNG